MSDNQGPYQRQPQDLYQQPQQPYQGYTQQPYPPQQPYQQPQQPAPAEPLYPPYPPAQQIGTYVPVMYVAKVPGSGVGPLTLGIIALALFALGVSIGSIGAFFGFIAFVLAAIGTPIAIVTLVRRIRAKLPLGISIAAVATNGFLIAILIVAIIATAGS